MILLFILSMFAFCFDIQARNETMHAHSWKQIQKQAQSSVVQIFAQRVVPNILQPWVSPQQDCVRGTGFFIDSNGYILTNAHVVDQSVALWIEIPTIGKRRIAAQLVGICHRVDVALLRIVDKELAELKELLGEITPLVLGDSDNLFRADEVMALGYPLQESFKSTIGVISGRQGYLIQTDAPINFGNSGGPLCNEQGEVVGIVVSKTTNADNTGYAIPINTVKVVLEELYQCRLVQRPIFGLIYAYVTQDTVEYLGNPQPGGCYIVGVEKNSLVEKAGLCVGDMLYEIDGNAVDIFGQVKVAQCDDAISICDYAFRVPVGKEITLIVYRKGQRLELKFVFTLSERSPVTWVYPGYEPIDYEIIGGMVIMQLSLDHVQKLREQSPVLGLFFLPEYKQKSQLIITHVFGDALLAQARVIDRGMLLCEINHRPVATLAQLRKVLQETVHDHYLVVRASNIDTDNLLAVLPYQKVLEEESQRAQRFHYSLSDTVTLLLEQRGIAK